MRALTRLRRECRGRANAGYCYYLFVRFAVASTLVIAGIVACGSFGTDGDEPPAATADAGAIDASSDVLEPKPDAGTTVEDSGTETVCAAAFCDDFERDGANVKGQWADLGGGAAKASDSNRIDQAVGPMGKVTRTYHLVTGVSKSEDHSFLVQNFPACAGKTMVVDFELAVDDSARDTNYGVVTLKSTRTTDWREFVGVALAGSSFIVKTQVLDNGSLKAPTVLASAVRPFQGWTHVHLAIDLRPAKPKISATFSGATTLNLAPKDGVAVMESIAQCDFTLGADYASSSSLVETERWHDDLRINFE